MGRSAADRGRAHAPWLHFALLLAVVTAFEAGRMLMPGASFIPSILLHYLYLWTPALAGIAMSISRPDERVTRDGIAVGLAAASLMILLDVWGSTMQPGAREGAALFPDASIGEMTELAEAAAVSWVETLLQGLRGELAGLGQMSTDYTLDHPRLRVAEAFAEAGLVLVIAASIGLVIAAISWIRVHVVFKRPESRGTSQIVMAWLIAPLLTQVTNNLAYGQRFTLLFRGGALWRPAVPGALALIVGVFAWWYTARYRESEDS